jgi:single-stranded DNA-binding protein
MGLLNEFKFIGRCYGDGYVTRTREGNLRVQFMLLVNDDFNRKDFNYIPCMCYREIAEQATLYCRDNNVISVEGQVCSTELFDKKKGVSYMKVVFIVTSIMLLTKATKKTLSERKFCDLVEIYQPDEFIEKIREENSEDYETNKD